MKRFTTIDRDGSKVLFLDEFKVAFQRCNFKFTDQEIATFFYLFDLNDKKYVDYEEFIINLRGPITARRRYLIEKAFQQLDVEGRGLVDPEDLIDRYDPTNHPDVKAGHKKAQEVFRDFLRVFEVSSEVDSRVTRAEFENYYFNLSSAVQRDEYFEQCLCNAWHISPEKDWETVSFDKDRNSFYSRSVANSFTHEYGRSDEVSNRYKSGSFSPEYGRCGSSGKGGPRDHSVSPAARIAGPKDKAERERERERERDRDREREREREREVIQA